MLHQPGPPLRLIGNREVGQCAPGRAGKGQDEAKRPLLPHRRKRTASISRHQEVVAGLQGHARQDGITRPKSLIRHRLGLRVHLTDDRVVIMSTRKKVVVVHLQEVLHLGSHSS